MKKQFGEAYFSYGWLVTSAAGLICGWKASEENDFRIVLGYMVIALLIAAFAQWCRHSS